MAMAAMMVERTFHRKRKTTSAASRPPSMRCVLIESTAALMKMDWSPTICVRTPFFVSAGSSSARRSFRASATSTEFCPDCFETMSVTAGWPFSRAEVRCSSAPSST